MKKTTIDEGLEAVRRELAKQDTEWEGVKRTLASFPRTELRVPEGALAELDGVCMAHAPQALKMTAIRG
jgi:hypothetical protein